MTKENFIPGICAGSDAFATKVTCSDGQIEVKAYIGSSDCSGTPLSVIKQDPGCVKTATGSSKYGGCDSSCITFKLFVAIITTFIISLF